MKHIHTTLFCVLILVGSVQAEIHLVDNRGSGDYLTIQQAINDDLNVFAGDTLYIQGSAQVYDGFTCDKRLVIIGTGYRLSDNPQTSASGLFPFIDAEATFIAGSEGSILSSVAFNEAVGTQRPEIIADNITIERCYLVHGITMRGDRSGIVIRNNYFKDFGIVDVVGTDNYQNVSLIGNIFEANLSVLSTSNEDRLYSVVEHNLFLGDLLIQASIFRNNIWVPYIDESNFGVSSGTILNNLAFNGQIGLENGNQGFSELAQVWNTINTGSFDGRFRLDPNSAFKGMATDGTDPGPFGGSQPYVLSGVPQIPIIYELFTTGAGSQEEGLPITIKIRNP
ncbi:MAG: hypothetical protein RIF33_03580 [Cyclobacteriaceae bacterium]